MSGRCDSCGEVGNVYCGGCVGCGCWDEKEKILAENERLKEQLALERSAAVELEIKYHNAEHAVEVIDAENERLKTELGGWKESHKELDDLALQLSDRCDSYFAENEKLRDDNRELAGCLARANQLNVDLLRETGRKIAKLKKAADVGMARNAFGGIVEAVAKCKCLDKVLSILEGEKKESTVTLQDAVDGAEKASKRIEDWPEWKKSMAYRYHDEEEGE